MQSGWNWSVPRERNICVTKDTENTILHIVYGFCGSNDLDLFKVMLYLMHLYALRWLQSFVYIYNVNHMRICIKLPSWKILVTCSNHPQQIQDHFNILLTDSTWFTVKVLEVHAFHCHPNRPLQIRWICRSVCFHEWPGGGHDMGSQ